MKYTALGLWSRSKFEQNQDSSKYTQYEGNPSLVIKEIKELINPEIQKFSPLDYATPASASFALLNEYSECLCPEELELCKEIILDYAITPFKKGYVAQISDGVEVAINAIPFLYKLFPDYSKDYNFLLLKILFDDSPIESVKRVCDYSIAAIVNRLWDISEIDALKIIYAFLKIKPLFNKFQSDIASKNKNQFRQRTLQSNIIKEFTESNEKVIEEVLEVKTKDIHFVDFDLKDFGLIDLDTAIQLVPNNSPNKSLNSFILKTIPILFENLLKDEKDTNYANLRIRFFTKICQLILNQDSKALSFFISPIVKHIAATDGTQNLLEEFIIAEDQGGKYEQFWIIWQEFYPHIVAIAKEGESNTKGIISTYLLASLWRGKNIKQWHSLKSKDMKFYEIIVSDLGDNVIVLDAISEVLNHIGSDFLRKGINLISTMLDNNTNLWTDKLGVNTVHYLDLLIRRYLFDNRTEVKRDKHLKKQVLVILDFLIEKSSVSAYLLREEIL